MSIRRRRAIPQVEAMESRALLSKGLPVLSMGTYAAVVSRVDRDLGALAKTGNLPLVTHALHQLSRAVPHGGDQLFPTWQAHLSIYQPTVPGSGSATEKQLLADLDQYIKQGVASGKFRVRGPGSTKFQPGPGNPASGPIGPINVNLPGNVTVVPNPPTASGNSIPYTLNYNFGYRNSSVTFTVPISSVTGGQFVLNATGQNRINWNLSNTMLLTGYRFTIVRPGTSASGTAFVTNAADQSGFFRTITYGASSGMLNQIVTMSNPTRPQFTYAYFQPQVTFRTFGPGTVFIQETPIFSNGGSPR